MSLSGVRVVLDALFRSSAIIQKQPKWDLTSITIISIIKLMVHCNQCEYEWEPMGGTPKVCTKCKRYDWQEPKKRQKVKENRDEINGTQAQERGPSGRMRRAGQPEGTEVAGEPVGNSGGVLGVEELDEHEPDGSDGRMDEVRPCRSCGDPLKPYKGFWVCMDLTGCAMGGQQQGKAE